MAADTLQARAIALRVAERLGRTLVAPPIPVGCSDHHLAFPGTVSVQAATLEAVYADYCRSLARHGFRRIGCFSGHGGNFGPLAEMLPRLRAAAAPARVAAFTDVPAYLAVWGEVLRDAGRDPALVGGHADFLETSIVAAIRPDLVQADRLERGFTGDVQAAFPAILRDGLQSVSANGILGDASTGLDAELGRRCLEATTRLLAGYFADESAWAPV
jgi:creatinine amidohydrolase